MTEMANCVYKTPCGWCSKWDKECDVKIHIKTSKTKHIKHTKNPCFNCVHFSMNIPWQCEECNEDNGFKHFSSK